MTVRSSTALSGADLVPEWTRNELDGEQQVMLTDHGAAVIYLYATHDELRRIADQLIAIAAEVEAES